MTILQTRKIRSVLLWFCFIVKKAKIAPACWPCSFNIAWAIQNLKSFTPMDDRERFWEKMKPLLITWQQHHQLVWLIGAIFEVVPNLPWETPCFGSKLRTVRWTAIWIPLAFQTDRDGELYQVYIQQQKNNREKEDILKSPYTCMFVFWPRRFETPNASSNHDHDGISTRQTHPPAPRQSQPSNVDATKKGANAVFIRLCCFLVKSSALWNVGVCCCVCRFHLSLQYHLRLKCLFNGGNVNVGKMWGRRVRTRTLPVVTT